MTIVYCLLAASAGLNFAIGTLVTPSADMQTRLLLRFFPLALSFVSAFFVIAWIMGWPV